MTHPHRARRFRLCCLAVWCLCLWGFSSHGWAKEVIQTRYATIIHEPADQAFAEHLASVVDADYASLLAALDMNIGPRVHIVISDEFGDQYNASATLAYKPTVQISPIPHQRYELLQPGDTQRMVLRHELAHILTGRKVPDPVIYRLGYVPGNNVFVPLAFHEGYAQWFETDAAAGQGRARGINPLSEGLWRQEYARGFQHYSQVFEVNLHQQAVLAYLYGAYFFSYLAERFGQDVVRDWTEKRSADYGWLTNLITPFTLHVAWQSQFEESLDDTWQDFLATETARIEQALHDPVQSETRTLRDDIARYRFPQAHWQSDDGSVSVWRDDRDGLRPSRLVIEHASGERMVRRGYQPVVMAGDEQNLWFNQIDRCGDQPAYSLYRLTVSSGQVDRVLPCSRIAAMDWHAESGQLAAWQLQPGGSRLVLMNAHGTVTETLLEAGYDLSIKALRWYPQSADLLVNLKPESTANFDLYRLDTSASQWLQLTDDNHIYHGAHAISDHGLVYSRPEQGLLQPFRRYHDSGGAAAGTEIRLAITPHNVLQPNLQANNTLRYLTESGFTYALRETGPNELADNASAVAILDSPLPEPLTRNTGHSESTQADSSVPDDGGSHPYLPIEHMAPTMVAPYPFWQGSLFSGEPGVGVLADWRDPTQLHQVTVNAQTLLVSTELQGTVTYTLDQQWQGGVGQALRQRKRHSGYRVGWQRDFGLSSRQGLSLETEWVSDHRHYSPTQGADYRRWLGAGAGYRFGERSHGRYRSNTAWWLDIDHEWALESPSGQRLRLTLSGEQMLWGQHSLKVTTRGLWTDQKEAPFVAGATVSEFSVFSRPIPTALTRHGLPEPLIGDPVIGDQLAYQRWSLSWLLGEPDRTAGTTGFGLNTLWFEPFVNAAWHPEDRALVNLGAEVVANVSLQWLLPLAVRLGYALEPIESGEGGLYLTIGPR